eukprot:gene3719-3766_t
MPWHQPRNRPGLKRQQAQPSVWAEPAYVLPPGNRGLAGTVIAPARRSHATSRAQGRASMGSSGGDLFRRIVGDLDTKLFFEGHHQLDDVERVGAKIVDEAGFFGDLVGLDAKVLDNDLLNAVGGIAHSMCPFRRNRVTSYGGSTVQGIALIGTSPAGKWETKGTPE